MIMMIEYFVVGFECSQSDLYTFPDVNLTRKMSPQSEYMRVGVVYGTQWENTATSNVGDKQYFDP